MIRIEYETAEYLPYEIKVKEYEALDKLIEITKNGGHINWIERI